MSMLPLKFLLLIIYLALLSIVLRLCELLVWYDAGFVASQIADPVSLSVRKLKNLLDARGVNYEGIVEKKELSQLVDQSGDVLNGELAEGEEDAELEDETTLFTSRVHFYEEVEDKKDSVWVIQVTPRGHRTLMTEKSWKTIRRKLVHFGIRTGSFDCSLDPDFCLRKEWFKSSILLAMPQGETYKDHVTMVHYYKPGPSSFVLDWINAHLRSKVTLFMTQNGAQEWMDNAKNRPNHFPIRVAYFSNAKQPPLFYSSLSVKFTGRIKFAFISTNKIEFSIQKHSSIKIPSIVISTPEGDIRYGDHPGEYISYDRLALYLKTISPDVNDAFIWSLFLVNILCIFEFFITQGGILKCFCYLLWNIGKSNFTFLAFWLPFLGMLQLSILGPFWNLTNKILRRFLMSNFMCYVRSDLLLYSDSTTFLLVTFLAYCCIIGFIEKYRNRSTAISQESNATWLRGVLQDNYMFLIRPSYRPRPQLNRAQVEEGLDRLIERLANPDFWLHPVILSDYISHLPTWKYCSEKTTGEPDQKSCESKPEELNVEGSIEQMLNGDSLTTQDVSDSRNDGNLAPSDYTACADDQLNRRFTDKSSLSPETNESKSSVVDKDEYPNNNIVSTECAICLDFYCEGVELCGLPCGHSYHNDCIKIWLGKGKHGCPNCRWPAYKAKGCKLLKHQE